MPLTQTQQAELLLQTLQHVYLTTQWGDEAMSREELDDCVFTTLTEVMGEAAFAQWLEGWYSGCTNAHAEGDVS